MVRKAAVWAAASGSFLASPAHASVAGVVQWDIAKRLPGLPPASALRRRAGTQQEDIVNSLARGGYFATCAVGTPPQDVILQLDTGSSDIWVPAHSASICEKRACSLGSFNPDASTTLDKFGPGIFDISYVDRSYAHGDYFRDAFSIANATVRNMTMGLGTNTTIAYGLLGIGYSTNEAIIVKEGAQAEFPNLPFLMMEEGLIATNAYSLWLNDLDADTGNILFGGIDTHKYVGNMTRIPIIKSAGTNQYDSFVVGLTSVRAASSSGVDRLSSAQVPIKVVLDSGTTLSYLPTDISEQIWSEVGAMYSPSLGLPLIPCNMRTSTGRFAFTFAGEQGPTIQVGMDELVMSLVVSGPTPTFTSGIYEGQDACEFGIQNTTGTNLLGDTFLRSAYVVYDLHNHEIGLAQTDFNATDSNIVPFPSRGAVIPSATLAPDQGDASSLSPSGAPPTLLAEAGFRNGTDNRASGKGPPMAATLSTVVFALAALAFL